MSVWVVTDHPTLPLEVQAVQRQLAVTVDGEFGDQTWAALLKDLGVTVNRIRYGVSVPGGPAATAAFEQQLGHPVAVEGEYFQATWNPLPTLQADKAAGRRTVLHVKPEGGVAGWKKPPSAAFLDHWAGAINKVGGGVDFIPHHEPENDHGQPSDYRNWASQVQSGLLERLTVADVRIGPCLMIGHVGSYADWLWAGADFLAWDGYGSLPSSKSDRSPAQLFDRPAAVNRQLGLPMLICETSAMVSHGKQTQFIADLVAYCPTIADVLDTVIVWSSHDQALTPESLAAYRAAFA